jgi:cytochrome c553
LAIAALLVVVATAAGKGGGELRPEVTEVLSLTPDLEHGSGIFLQCAGCHASPSNGLPQGWVPNITGQHPAYLAKQLVDYRHSVRFGARMEPVAKGHSLHGLQDVADVVAFVAAQPADWNRPSPSHGVAGADRRFYRRGCSGCHGQTGEGSNSTFVPRIGGLNFAYLLRQMHDVVDGRRPNMEAQHLRALADLDLERLLGLSHYIAHLGAGGGAEGAPEVPSPSLIHDPAAPGSH